MRKIRLSRRGGSIVVRIATTFFAAVLITTFAAVAGVATADTSTPDSAAAPAAASGVVAPVPPPIPVMNGRALAGAWHGPYHLQNFGSGKCVEIGNEATYDGAPANQWTCMAPWTQQKWWVWDTVADCCVAIQFLFNDHSRLCLETWSGHQVGVQLTQGICHWDSSELWIKSGGTESGYWIYRNEFSQLCMGISGSSPSNGAAVVQLNCTGAANQRFATRQY